VFVTEDGDVYTAGGTFSENINTQEETDVKDA